MSENTDNSGKENVEQANNGIKDSRYEDDEEKIEKFIPHFFPTFRIKRTLYPIPIIIVVAAAGILAYLTYTIAGVRVDGGYIQGGTDPLIGLLNGLIFTATAVISAFVMIYFAKKKGIEVLKYIFGFSFGMLGFFISYFFGGVIIWLIFRYSDAVLIYNITDFTWLIITGILTIFMLYRYFTSESLGTKNFIVIYIGLSTGAFMGVVMPLWTTLAILIGISCWDIFAVLYKRGPIKEMIDLASQAGMTSEEEKIEEDKIESGKAVYDTAKLEIGIGDLAFYSMLTSSALILSNNILVMILTAIAVIVGTGITISGLKRNKVLPGLPISIFLGIASMLISGGIFFLLP